MLRLFFQHIRIRFSWILGVTLVIASIMLGIWESSVVTLPSKEVAFPHQVIRIGMDISYPPFARVKSDKLYGIDVVIAEAISQQIDLPLQIVPISFDGLYDALLTDRVDVIISALIVDPQRTNDVRYTMPYYDGGLRLVVTQSSRLSYYNLSGANIAFEFGSYADGALRQHSRRMNDVTLMPYEKPVYALDAVRLGLADGAVVDATTYLLYSNQYPDWHTKTEIITYTPYAMAVRIDRIETYQLIQQTLETLFDAQVMDHLIQMGITEIMTIDP